MDKILTDENFILYAMHHYDNPQCNSIHEFDEDLKRFLYLKKLFYRYRDSDELRERLILNQLIVLFNIFGDATLNMLFFKIDSSCWKYLVTFLVYLERMPDTIKEHGIILSEIILDENIISVLRKI